MNQEIKCPQCRQPVVWQDNPDRPFCSERCRLIDLGQWADESYRIKSSSQELSHENNVVDFHKENKQLKGHN